MNIYEREQRKKLSEPLKLSNNIFVSQFEGLTLPEYVEVKRFVCLNRHKNAGKKCSCDCLIKVAEYIQRKGYMELKDAFQLSCPKLTSYTALQARQKLLQMPLAAIRIGNPAQGTLHYVVVAKQQSINYTVFQSLLEKSLESSKVVTLSKGKMTELLFLAESEAEKERLRYAVVKSSSLSSTQARRIYGFRDINRRIDMVNNAATEAQSIKECIEKICRIKDKSLLRSFGVDDDDDGSSSGSESDSESASDSEDDMECASSTQRKDCTVPSCEKCLDLLRSCNLNWFEFAKKVQDLYKDAGTEAIESALLDFMKSITLLDISPKDKKIIEQSRTAYFASKKACEKEYDIAEGMIVSESESGEDECQLWTSNEDVLGERGRAVLVKKRAALKRKTVCEIKKRVAERRFLKRRRSKKMSKIVKDYPEIGMEIEKFVKDCGVGADAWRRTGILTFDGNRKLQKKATFKRIKEHLEQVYQRSFAYGTVVQLCVARNKRRKSAERYQGLANVTQRRARKGFNTNKTN